MLIMLFLAMPVLSACTGGCLGSCTAGVGDVAVTSKPSITAYTLHALMLAGVRLNIIEVFKGKNASRRVIPGARSVYFETDSVTIETIFPDKEEFIIVYTVDTGINLGLYCDKLRELGYLNVVEYPGGIKAWLEEGYETAYPEQDS